MRTRTTTRTQVIPWPLAIGGRQIKLSENYCLSLCI